MSTHLKYKVLLQSMLEWYQFSSGLSTPILKEPTNLTYINSILLQDLISFMFQTHIFIATKDYFVTKG